MRAAGHHLTLAVTSEFPVLEGTEWLVFGKQFDGEKFRTRPETVVARFSRPVIETAAALR